MDTTVAEAKILYPTDTNLLADGVRVITRRVARLKGLGTEVGVGFMDHTRKVKKVCLGLSKVLKERIDGDNPRLVKAKDELLKLVEEVGTKGKQAGRGWRRLKRSRLR